MNAIRPFIHGNVRVTWNANNSVDEITYNGEKLIDALNTIIVGIQFSHRGIMIPRRLATILNELLDTIGALPTNRADLKLFLADNIFGYFLIDSVPPNPKLKIAILQKLMEEVWNWEDIHEKIHKGTPYFFLDSDFYTMVL